MKILLTTLSLGAVAISQSSAAIIWNAGKVDNLQQYTGAPANQGPGGGGENVRFIQEIGGATPLPGSATNTGGEGAARDIDDDYYFAGVYTTTVFGAYAPVGIVAANEENMERAFTHTDPSGAGDRNLRFHFNFPATVTASDLIKVNFGITGMESIANAAGWSVEVKLNGVSLLNQAVAPVANADFSTSTFNLAAVSGTAGPGFDNYVELIGTSLNPTAPGSGGSRWLSIDYVEMDVTPVPEPTSFGFFALAAGTLLLARRRRRVRG